MIRNLRGGRGCRLCYYVQGEVPSGKIKLYHFRARL